MIQYNDNIESPVEVCGTSSEVYRRFTQALTTFSDFERFRESLVIAIEGDPHLANELLMDRSSSLDLSEESEVFEKGRVVVPLKGLEEGGYLKIDGRRDERPFGAQDIHLMGSIADFVSILFMQSKKHHRLKERAQVLQFLIDQLPLGIVCFDAQGELLTGNRLAWKQLGLEQQPIDAASAPILAVLRDGVGEVGEAHFEAEGRLMFSMRRVFEPKVGEPVAAYVIYDLSKRRSRLVDSLDREYYKARCVDSAVTVALLQCNTAPGSVYDHIKQSASVLNLNNELIQPLDAYTCACVFPDKCIPDVRALFADLLRSKQFEGLRVSLVSADDNSQGSPGGDTIQKATEKLQPFETALLPQLLVFDSYRPVFETLALMLEGVVCLTYCGSYDAVLRQMRTERYDGIILEVDSIDSETYNTVCLVAHGLGRGFKVFHSSIQQKGMLADGLGLRGQVDFLQKPFDAAVVVDAVSLQFNLA